MAKTTKELIADATRNAHWIDRAEAQQRFDQGAAPVDVREDHEYEAGHLPNAIHISRGCLEFKIGNHPATQDPNAELVLYCKGGGRTALAAQRLQEMGYTNVLALDEGYDGWVAAGEPVEGAATDEEE